MLLKNGTKVLDKDGTKVVDVDWWCWLKKKNGMDVVAKIAVQKPRIFSIIFMLKIDQNVATAGFVAHPLLIFGCSLKDA